MARRRIHGSHQLERIERLAAGIDFLDIALDASGRCQTRPSRYRCALVPLSSAYGNVTVGADSDVAQSADIHSANGAMAVNAGGDTTWLPEP